MRERRAPLLSARMRRDGRLAPTRRLAEVAGVLLALAGALLTGPAPAAGAAADPGLACPAGAVCMFEGTHYTGRQMTTRPPGTGVCLTWPHFPARSAINNSTAVVVFYSDSGCLTPVKEPPAGVLPPGQDTPVISPAAQSLRAV